MYSSLKTIKNLTESLPLSQIKNNLKVPMVKGYALSLDENSLHTGRKKSLSLMDDGLAGYDKWHVIQSMKQGTLVASVTQPSCSG